MAPQYLRCKTVIAGKNVIQCDTYFHKSCIAMKHKQIIIVDEEEVDKIFWVISVIQKR